VRGDNQRELARIYVCRDITESRDFQKMMIRLDRYYTRGEMAGDIAHEINNYLAVLMGNVELLPLLLKKGDQRKIDRKLEVMWTTLEKIARFADGLLDGPPDTARLEPTSINQVVENVIAFLKPQNKFDTVNVVKDLATDVPVIYVDRAQIQQLLVNLIYNAAEALAEKEGERTIVVATATADPENSPGVRVVIRDNGPGVAPDKENLLFKTRFTTKQRGHGIGLITCRKIVDNHAGSISYRREDGAVFSFVLPVGAHPERRSEHPTESHAYAEPV
jgi:C4-dicarboxylate-specific signal transduction histidine kinase